MQRSLKPICHFGYCGFIPLAFWCHPRLLPRWTVSLLSCDCPRFLGPLTHLGSWSHYEPASTQLPIASGHIVFSSEFGLLLACVGSLAMLRLQASLCYGNQLHYVDECFWLNQGHHNYATEQHQLQYFHCVSFAVDTGWLWLSVTLSGQHWMDWCVQIVHLI